MSKKNLGTMGENIAAQHLQAKGYSILEMNWRCRLGEIDIIAQNGDTLIFCEVKTRRGKNVQDALASITANKREKFMKAVYHYLDENGHDEILWRIDAIGIALPANGNATIEHVEDALDW